MTAETTTDAAGVSLVERGVRRLEPERDLAGLTTAELRAEIGRMQQELTRRVCGDPVQGIGLRLGGKSAALLHPIGPTKEWLDRW